jgi:glycosyltransferase involved in cell wall biosynthesis
VTPPRVIAVLPAFHEEEAIGAVVAEIRALHPDFDVLVVDDASGDDTAAAAAAAGAAVVRLPYNLGIGGAVQTGFKAALEGGYDVVVRLDGDGQHDPGQVERLLAPVLRDEADVVTGSRFVDRDAADGYRPPLARRIGITWFAWLVSALTRRRVTDTTSGFQALNRRALEVFADDYPSDYPEVEASLLIARCKLRSREVQVSMREREHGRSSITFVRSVYYMLKVTLALLVAMARKPTLPDEAPR